MPDTRMNLLQIKATISLQNTTYTYVKTQLNYPFAELLFLRIHKQAK